MTDTAKRSAEKGLRTLTGVRAAAIAVLVALAPSAASAQFFWDRNRLDADDAARAAISQGFQVLSRPVRDDDVYVVEAVNRRGGRERLIIAGDTGQILQRFSHDGARGYRRFQDSSIPPGPTPPGRIPGGERQEEPSLLSKLFGGGDRSPADLTPSEPRGNRPSRQRRTARAPEPGTDTVRDIPVESAPLVPPGAAPTLPPRVAKPAPAKAVPAQAALPPAAATPVPSSEPATPAAPAAGASDRPVRSISTNPLAIPGSREQDEKGAGPKSVTPGTAAPQAAAAKSPAAPLPPKDPVVVAPLD